ncbi:MAG TPA: exodeoxyribonuclease VII small subunit [Polyangiaceae bacterium]|nr:exodeoxyribonuclease VII small subunit [Polyangiaceae bacterium]
MAPHDECDEVADAVDAPSFEASAERLQTIVEQLESGELPLEKSLELFEEGVKVARDAQARLDAAEKRVEELLGVDEEGRARTRPFES